jgi:hypothetical protein
MNEYSPNISVLLQCLVALETFPLVQRHLTEFAHAVHFPPLFMKYAYTVVSSSDVSDLPNIFQIVEETEQGTIYQSEHTSLFCVIWSNMINTAQPPPLLS